MHGGVGANDAADGADEQPITRVHRPSASDAYASGPPAANVEAIAQRVAELLVEEVLEARWLLDTPAVARMLSVSEDWVRAHAAELGAIRVGDGPKGALRFDARRVRTALEHRRLDRPRERHQRRPGPRRRSLGVLPAGVPENVRDW